MGISELVTAEQYLHTSFEYDAEFVEGKIVERSLPAWEHGCVQGHLIRVLFAQGAENGLFVIPGQRVCVRPDRFRVPDVCVAADVPSWPAGKRIVTLPPHLCVEILSPEDTTVETLEKVREYLIFGVAWVWVIDPVSRAGQIHNQSGVIAVENKIFFTDRCEVDLTAIHGLT
jgi:Uma2 family endonuclease